MRRTKTIKTILFSSVAIAPALYAAEKPNVLFILVDDLGYHQMGCYGSSYYETPNLDKLASQSMKFTNAYAAAALSSPTRASIMSGKYPARVGVTDWIPGWAAPANAILAIPNWTQGLPASELSLPQRMKSAGYRTSLIGKWHCSSYLTGWDESYVFDGPKTVDGCNGVDCHRVEEYTDSTLSFLKRNKDKPFFCFLSHNTIHVPEAENSALIQKYANKAGSLDGGQLNPTQGAMVETLDKYTGILLDSLDRMGLSENTLVIVFSDNGQHSPNQEVGVSPLRGGKCSFYEGGFREPLLVRWKGKIIAGSLCSQSVMSQDFLPTIAEICGFSVSNIPNLDGKSFAKNLTVDPETQKDRPYLCWHYPHYAGVSQFLGAIKKGDWKLIENFNQSLYFNAGAFELYNLKNDPKETTNLLETNPEKAAELYTDLQTWRKDTKAQMPGMKNPVYGTSHFQFQLPNQPIKAENFEIQSGLSQWLQYDGTGTYLTLNSGAEISYYINISQAGNYKLNFLCKNNASATLFINSPSLDGRVLNILTSTGWNTSSTEDIYFSSGIHKVVSKVNSGTINLDKFSVTNESIPLIHDGVQPIIGKQINIGFETSELPLYSSIEGSAYNQSALPQIVTNPDRLGLNPTEKCLYAKTKKDLTVSPKIPAWSTNFITITFNDQLNITDDNRYFHMLHRKGQVLNNWLVYASEDGTNFVQIGSGVCPSAQTWFDIVSDIKLKFTSIKKIRIYLDSNWSGTDDLRYYSPTDFYYDELALTNSSAPRRSIPSAVEKIESQHSKIYPNPVNGYMRIESDESISSVSFRNGNGSKVKTISGNELNNTVINTENLSEGFYLVEIKDTNGVSKLMKIIKQ